MNVEVPMTNEGSLAHLTVQFLVDVYQIVVPRSARKTDYNWRLIVKEPSATKYQATRGFCMLLTTQLTTCLLGKSATLKFILKWTANVC